MSDPQLCKARIAVSGLRDAVKRFTCDPEAALDVIIRDLKGEPIPAASLRCRDHTRDSETDAST